MKSVRGFTLVELLVVIAIIAILSMIGLSIYAGMQKAARDARRRSDLEQYRIALQSYAANNNGKYPSPGGTSSTTTYQDLITGAGVATGIFTNSGPLISDGYLPSALIPPLQQDLANRDVYRYWYIGGAKIWKLYTGLEGSTTQGWQICSDGRVGQVKTTTDANCNVP